MSGVLCGDCYDLVMVAARPVLEALQSFGLKPSPRQLDAAIRSGSVATLFQEPLSGM